MTDNQGLFYAPREKCGLEAQLFVTERIVTGQRRPRLHTLSLDVGTSALKAGVFDANLQLVNESRIAYEFSVDGEFAEIDSGLWWDALQRACSELRDSLHEVECVSLSVTTPGLAAMDADGNALHPAILFLDGRSRREATDIRERVGDDVFLSAACNLPASGGSSLCSIMWLKANRPDVWQKTHKFGHTNTFVVRRLSGEWVIDPSTVSITGMYNTADNNLTWNNKILTEAGIPEDKLPRLMHSGDVAGEILPQIADELGIPRGAQVLCGGNDAVLAAYSAGLDRPGQVVVVSGTADIVATCIHRPVASHSFNVRCHVDPRFWVIFFVLNTGGKAFEWFRGVFCSEMSQNEFYVEYMPSVITAFLERPDRDDYETQLPQFTPYLQGSRYTTERLSAAFEGMTLDTDRDALLLSTLRGNMEYIGQHLAEVEAVMKIDPPIVTAGGAAEIPGMQSLKQHWMGPYTYKHEHLSSLRGAALLAAKKRGEP